jgi:hypothetical protein
MKFQRQLTDIFIPKILDEKLNSENGAKKCLKFDASTLEIFDFEQIIGLNKTFFKGKIIFFEFFFTLMVILPISFIRRQ